MGSDKSATKWLQINNNANIKPDGMDSWIYRIQSPGSHTVVGVWNPKSNPNSMWILWKGRGLKNPFRDSLLVPVTLAHYETIPFSIPHITLL